MAISNEQNYFYEICLAVTLHMLYKPCEKNTQVYDRRKRTLHYAHREIVLIGENAQYTFSSTFVCFCVCTKTFIIFIGC